MKTKPKWIVIDNPNASKKYVCELQQNGTYLIRSTVNGINLAITMAAALNDREDILFLNENNQA